MCLRISINMKTMMRKNKNLSHICQFSTMEIYFVSVTDYIPEKYLAIVRRKKKKKKVLHGQNVNQTFYHSFKTALYSTGILVHTKTNLVTDYCIQ